MHKNPSIVLTSRILMSVIFIFAGYGKIMDPAGTQGYMSSVGMPLVGLMFIAAVVIELGGGLLLLVGFQARLAAAALALFSVVSAVFFHMNWAGDGGQTQMIMFMKNLAMAGGLMMIFSAGAGKLSVDERASDQA